MESADYTEREVIWLLSIDHDTALEIDAAPPSSFPDLLTSNFNTGGATGASDERPLLTVLRWQDVHVGRARMASLIDEDVLELRLQGLTQDQIAIVLERSQQMVSAAWKDTVGLVLDDLAGG